MPAPTPDDIYHDLCTGEGGRLVAFVWRSGNRRNRAARFERIYARLKGDDWTCSQCGKQIGMHKRADARYCGNPCRKSAAHKRRKQKRSDVTQFLKW